MEVAEVQRICSALDALLNPNIDYAARTEALKICESYKSDPRCAEVGFHLANAPILPPNVRYYGLQLIKHRVRMNWTSLSTEEKIAMKSLTFNLISSCSTEEPIFIKSLLASIINEIVKHIWPQQWPSMVNEVIENSDFVDNAGPLEVVLIFFLSLAEDVALYHNVTTKSRAKDLRQALSVAAPDIFGFLLKVLSQTLSQLTKAQPSYQDHICKVTLNALEAYVEWINVNLVFTDDGALFYTLFQLFSFENLRLPAAECLLAIVSRKGHLSDRLMLVKLTEESFVQKYAESIKVASQLEGFGQANFQFLFTMGKIISALSFLLIGVWEDGERKTENCPNELFSRKFFLETVFFLSSQESQVIAQTVMFNWTHFLRHPVIRKDETLLSLIPVLVDLASGTLGIEASTKNQFSPFEEACFSDLDEIAYYANNFHNYGIEMLRSCASVAPLITLQKCFDYVEKRLDADYRSIETAQSQIDNVLSFIGTVVNPAVTSAEESGEIHLLPITRGENLLKLILAKKTNDLVIMRLLVSSAFALLKLLVHSKDPSSHFKLLVDHLFYILDCTASDLSKAQVGSLRRQVGATMVRSAKTYSKVFVNLTEHLKMHILKRLSADPCVLFSFEKVAMFESLILISLEWNDFEQQSKLIADVMSTTVSIVQNPAFVEALRGPFEFAKNIGVAIVSEEVNDVTKDPSAEVRSNFYYYCALVYSVLNRTQEQGCKVPNVPNPAGPHLSDALDRILAMTYLLSSMWTPEVRGRFAPENLKSLELRDCEKRNLICQSSEIVNTSPDEKAKTHWERLQIFLVLTLDQCYMTLGLIGKVLGPDFYKMPQLLQIILHKLFGNIEHLPCLRLKSFLRQFLASFCKSCPIDNVNDVVSPILQFLCQFMMSRLQPAWNAYGKREFERLEGAEDIDDLEEKEEDEMLEEQILRVITREHLDLLINLIVNKKPPSQKNDSNDAQNGDVDMKSADTFHVDQVTSLGAAIAASPCIDSILYSVLRTVTWYDTTSCQKSILLLSPLLKQLIQTNPNQFNADLTTYVLQSLLNGLARHGQHDGCEAPVCALLLMLIQNLMPFQANVVTEILLSTQQDEMKKDEMQYFLDKFDKTHEKKRKVDFRKLVSNIIIRHASQRYKEIPQMNTFDPIPRRKKMMLVKSEVESFGLAELFQPSQ